MPSRLRFLLEDTLLRVGVPVLDAHVRMAPVPTEEGEEEEGVEGGASSSAYTPGDGTQAWDAVESSAALPPPMGHTSQGQVSPASIWATGPMDGASAASRGGNAALGGATPPRSAGRQALAGRVDPWAIQDAVAVAAAAAAAARTQVEQAGAAPSPALSGSWDAFAPREGAAHAASPPVHTRVKPLPLAGGVQPMVSPAEEEEEDGDGDGADGPTPAQWGRTLHFGVAAPDSALGRDRSSPLRSGGASMAAAPSRDSFVMHADGGMRVHEGHHSRSRSGSQGGAGDSAGASQRTRKDVSRRVHTVLLDYFATGNVRELAASLTAPELLPHHSEVVVRACHLALERGPLERSLLFAMLVLLAAPPRPEVETLEGSSSSSEEEEEEEESGDGQSSASIPQPTSAGVARGDEQAAQRRSRAWSSSPHVQGEATASSPPHTSDTAAADHTRRPPRPPRRSGGHAASFDAAAAGASIGGATPPLGRNPPHLARPRSQTPTLVGSDGSQLGYAAPLQRRTASATPPAADGRRRLRSRTRTSSFEVTETAVAPRSTTSTLLFGDEGPAMRCRERVAAFVGGTEACAGTDSGSRSRRPHSRRDASAAVGADSSEDRGRTGGSASEQDDAAPAPTLEAAARAGAEPRTARGAACDVLHLVAATSSPAAPAEGSDPCLAQHAVQGYAAAQDAGTRAFVRGLLLVQHVARDGMPAEAALRDNAWLRSAAAARSTPPSAQGAHTRFRTASTPSQAAIRARIGFGRARSHSTSGADVAPMFVVEYSVRVSRGAQR